MRLHKILLLVLAVILAAPGAGAQKKIISGIVKDSHSDETVPFASVSFKNTHIGKLTDTSGSFTFYLNDWPSDTLEITSVGYQPFFVIIDKRKDSVSIIIPLERGTFNEGVKLKVNVNKGLLVWRKIVQHKPEHDRSRYSNFSYELYNRLELDLKNINFSKFSKFKPLRPIGELINRNIDSSDGLRYLPAYLTEVLSDYYFQEKPLKRREVIKAVNPYGVKNESMVKLLGGMDQIVNVYNNFIPVMDKQFVSPLSEVGDKFYNYRVVDTQLVNNSRYYHLVFTPRHKGTDTFEGDCWVQVGSFAIQKMNLRLGKDANVNFLETLSLIQEFKLINDTTWFLSKDKFVADISPVGKGKPGFIGRKTTTYKNVVIDDSSVVNELNKNKILEEVVTQTGADQRTKDYWNFSRHENLTKSESSIGKMIDTLTNAPAFKKFTKTMYFIGLGYVDVGKFELGPWMNWFTSNSWEGFRTRFDLGTNKHFNDQLKLHGYLAYGFRDKKWKGMADLFYLQSKKPRTYYYASYSNDMDYGQSYYGEVSQDNIFALAIRKNNVPVKKIMVNEKRFEFFRETFPWMSTEFILSHKAYLPLKNLLPVDSFPVTGSGKPLTSFEVSLQLRFAYLEKFLESNFYRSSLGSPYPVAELNIAHGFPNIFNSSYSYTKVSLNISDNFGIPPLGTISWSIYGGKTFGTLPYTFLDIAPGNEIYYYNKYAYNMMNRWEYLHDKYAGINIEHNMGNGIFRLIPKLRFRQFWTAKVLWGSLSEANKTLNFKVGNNFQTLDGKTYLELGTGIDNIFHVFRLDFIWRVLPTPLPKNTNQRFGAFGSFRLVF